MKKKSILLLSLLFLFGLSQNVDAEEYTLYSPDKKIELKITIDGSISYSVAFNKKPILSPSAISLTLENEAVLGKDPKVWKTNNRMINEKIYPVVPQKNRERKFPWRVLIFAEKDGDLIESEMVFKLAEPNQIKDYSWIKPGKVAWDWWNWNNIYGVDFEAGVNTETYKYYIDFASKYGLEYIILDEGWYKPGDLLDINPDINMDELVEYAKGKNVGIILWVIWKTLDDQLEEALGQFEKWEIKGIKVDFMQRDDQWMVQYYHKIAREAAKRYLLVDFHGAYKPAGLRRAYPNVITREGVRGLEWCKWSEVVDPEHDVTIPFIRMFAGPMDYTPGAMVNAQKENFKSIFSDETIS